MRVKALTLASLLFVTNSLFAFQSFKVDQVQVQGLSRLSKAMVLSNVPVQPGQQLTPELANETIQDLFKTGYFKNIVLQKNGNNLIVKVQERPTISSIKFEGNKLLKTKQLSPVLLKVGLEVGNMFEASTLSRLQQSIEQQYFSIGKYAARVTTEIKNLPRNRVSIILKVSEGLYTKVARINFVGNHHYASKTLADQITLSTPSFWTFFNGDDEFTQTKLSSSLQQLSDFYMDHGFLKFHINSSQASLTPTHKKVLLTVNLSEGSQYHFSNISLQGKFIVPKATLEKLIQTKEGQVFSRKEVMDTAKAIQLALADKGYAFATVNPTPNIDEDNKTVAVTFNVNPGKRVYVSRIRFQGNDVTNDRTLRERATFPEESLYNQTKVDHTKLRLQRLPYVESVQQTNTPVSGSTDQVDVGYKVKERSANKIGASLGYSELNKVILGAYLTMPNVFGTGNVFSINTQVSKPYQQVNFTYTEPYFTQSGVSQSINIYGSKVKNNYTSLVSYSMNQLGANLTYGIPLSTFNTLNLGGGVDHSRLVNPYNSTSLTVQQFTQKHGNNYNTLSLTFGVSHDTTNDAFFPSTGDQLSVGTNVATPVSNLTWYKLNGSAAWFHPIYWDRFVFGINGSVHYGNGYGKIDELPFFQNFYSGGWGSVRGYSQGTLGPQDTINCGSTASDLGCTSEGDALGGNFSMAASINIYFPTPFITSNRNIRMGVFADAGNVYDTQRVSTAYENRNNPTHPTFQNLRYSVGLELQWLSPLGALGFSIAKPLNSKPGDDLQYFQFTLGQTF